jgi:PKD domain
MTLFLLLFSLAVTAQNPTMWKSCENFKVSILKSKTGGQKEGCCYDIVISNSFKGTLLNLPGSFTINVSGGTIKANSGKPAGWIVYSSPGSFYNSSLTWRKLPGYIPKGETKLGNVCIEKIINDPFYVKYEWRDIKGRLLCADSVRVNCKDTEPGLPTCGKFAIALHNGVSATMFSKIRITEQTGSKLVNAVVGEPDEDGDNEWTQVTGPNYSYVEWSRTGSSIPYDAATYLDEDMYIWMDPSVGTSQAVRIDWYDATNTVIASQVVTLPCFGNPATLYADSYNWEANTTIVSGANLDVFAGASPEECTLDALQRNASCSNQITYSILCVGNKPVLSFSNLPLVQGEAGVYWNLTDPDGNTTVPVNNMQLTKSGKYTLALTVTHLPVYDYTDPANPVEITPIDCDYEVNFHVAIPTAVISEPIIKPVQQNPSGCNFQVSMDAFHSANTSSSHTYSWLITGPNSFSHSFTGKSISYVFVDQGVYTVTLTITDDYGCTHTVTRQFTLSYLCQPKFSWGTYEWCKNERDTMPKNITIDFTNISMGGKCPITYKWDFGDPASGTLNNSASTNPQHTYNSVPYRGKSFTVKLTMTDANNCMKVYTEVIRLEPYFVNFSVQACPDGKVYFSTNNNNPQWTFPGSNSTIKWVSQHILGLFGWYHNNDPEMEYETGDYTATLKATSNSTHAWCRVSKQFHVDKICCNWRVKGKDEIHNTIGGSFYKMKMRWKWKVKKFHPLNVVRTKVKVTCRIKKRLTKKYRWYRRVMVPTIYAGIEGKYYTKDPTGICDCVEENTLDEVRRTCASRSQSTYRLRTSQVRNIREQSMKAKFGVIINGVSWDQWRYFTPCH